MATRLGSDVLLRRQHLGIIVVAFAAIGILLLLRSYAAVGTSLAFEAEAGARSGPVAVTSETGANGGSHVSLNSGGGQSASVKPRMIAMTDGEIDDTDSFVRFLMYSNDFEIVGIVPTNSRWQKNGHGRGWIDNLIDAYAQVRPNLLLHDADYPTAEYLKSKVHIGIEDINTIWGEPPFADTPGSELILSELRKDDPRPLYLNAWGGANTAAQALHKLKTTYPGELAAAASKALIYTIHSPAEGQDNGWKWIGDNIPQAEVIVGSSYLGTWDYTDAHNPFSNEYKKAAWLNANVKSGHGPLGEKYAQSYISEGDTPAFMPLVANGLRAHEAPGFGGWGGRFKKEYGNVWVDAPDGGSIHQAITRWFVAAQNDFAARMDWGVKPYDQANHQPTVQVSGQLNQTVTPGATVQLSASVSDPDGDSVSTEWWQYPEAGTAGAITINNKTSASGASFTVPNEPGKTIHVIFEATDNGSPALKRYSRIVYTIAQ